MTELQEAFLSVVLVGLAGILAIISLLANNRYHDRRFLIVSFGMLCLGAAGVMSLLSIFWPPVADTLDIGPGPLIALVLASILLNAPLFHRQAPPDVGTTR